MKVACLILAYRGADVLARCQPVLAAAGWDVYVHLDRKANISNYAHALGSAGRGCFFVDDPLNVFWGGYSMMQAEFKLIETAREVASYDKYVLLSDDAFPILPPDALAEHLTKGEDYVTCKRQPPKSEFYTRYDKFFFYDHPATMMRDHGTRCVEIDINFEHSIAEISVLRRIGKKKIDVYFGSQFWSLSGSTIEFVMRKVREDLHLTKSFQYSALPDETMIQSILGNYIFKRDRDLGPVYADLSGPGGPREFSRVEDLPFDLRPHQIFERKFGSGATSVLDTLQARLMCGRTIYGLEPKQRIFGTLLACGAGSTEVNLRLGAPVTPCDCTWHPIEAGENFHFRWTADTRVNWDLGPRPVFAGGAQQ
jgi:hypothetical protein